jgi:hypothetical protein
MIAIRLGHALQDQQFCQQTCPLDSLLPRALRVPFVAPMAGTGLSAAGPGGPGRGSLAVEWGRIRVLSLRSLESLEFFLKFLTGLLAVATWAAYRSTQHRCCKLVPPAGPNVCIRAGDPSATGLLVLVGERGEGDVGPRAGVIPNPSRLEWPDGPGQGWQTRSHTLSYES